MTDASSPGGFWSSDGERSRSVSTDDVTSAAAKTAEYTPLEGDEPGHAWPAAWFGMNAKAYADVFGAARHDDAMARGIEGDETPQTFPAVGLRGVATWVVDAAAASTLSFEYAECFALASSRGDCCPPA